MTPTSTKYHVELEHHDDGELDVKIFDVGSSERDRESVAWALEEAARQVRSGLVLDLQRLN